MFIARFFLPLCLLSLLLQTASAAQSAPVRTPADFPLGENARLRLEPNGLLRLDDLSFLMDYREAGRGTRQDSSGALGPAADQPRLDPDQHWSLEAAFKPRTSAHPLDFHETLERTGPDSARLTIALAANHPDSPVHAMRWIAQLPETTFAGRSIRLGARSVLLPDKPVGRFDLATARGETVSIPLEHGTLELRGNFNVLVADNRYYGQGYFSLILETRVTDEAPATRAFTCDYVYRPHTFDPVDFRAAANRGFADDVAGDRAGGWTDEGHGHDLRTFPLGEQTLLDVPFAIIDPAQNHGRSALVFSGPQRPYFIDRAELAPPANAPRVLYLLHAYAWDQPQDAPIGTLVATHPDGSTTTLAVQAHRDAGNWTAPHDAPNGRLAWRGSTPRFSGVGLYLSRFELPGKPVTRLTVEGSGQAVWMIAGLTTSPDPVPPFPPLAANALVLAAGPDWQPLDFAHDVASGSILDFSSLLDAPAGKHGPVLVRDGHFYFENQPDQRVRFFGTNLNYATNVIDHELADRLATRLAAYGYNSARIHHYDAVLLKTPAAHSHDIDPEKLDRLDYLFAALKSRGLYINIDLFSTRHFAAGEIDEVPARTRNGIKSAVPVSPSAQRAWEQFALKLLTHRNPYTGLTWAEDPALVGICPINENVLSATWASASSDASIAQLYQRRFAEWLEAQNLPPPSERDRALAFARFLSERQETSRASVAAFLKTNLGVRAPLTDVNHRDYKPLALARDHLDYVDIHRYWDHPNFAGAQWGLPYLHLDEPALARAAELPRQLFPARIVGLPFASTEFNYTYPNRYRAESGPLFGAYAAFQDWDAIYRFAYNGNLVEHLVEPSPIMSFNSSNDPVATLADRLIALLFLRGDVAPSTNLIAFEINPATAFASPEALGSYSDDVSKLGLVSALGTVVTGNARSDPRRLLATVTEPGGRGTLDAPSFEETPDLPQRILAADILNTDRFDPAAGRYRSDTGELDLDVPGGRFSVLTPRTEVFMLTKPDTAAGPILLARTDGPAMVSVSAMDGQPLATSRRLLVLHLTDVQNTGARFRDETRKILEDWGSAPLLVRRGTAELTLRLALPADAAPRAWRLSPSGQRLGEIPVQFDAAGLRFTAHATSPDGPALAYEIELAR